MSEVPMGRVISAVALLFLLTACGGGYSSPSTPSPSPSPAPSPSPSPAPSPGSTGASVTIPDNARALGTGAFVPNPITITQGGAVTWTNSDSTTHDMVSD